MKATIIDDDPFTIVLVAHMLNEAGVKSNSYLSLTDNVLEEMVDDIPDVIILDVMMGETESFSFLSKIKETPIIKDIPVVVISADHSTDKQIKYITKGVLNYICKPFDKDCLVNAVKQAGLLGSLFKSLNRVAI